MNDRRRQIVKLVNDCGAVNFAQLKAFFKDVSEMTLRNDLRALDEERLIVRVHGGAKSVDRIIGTDDLLNKRLARNIEKKKMIAQKAIKLLSPGTSVFLDSGSTITEFTKNFPDESHLIFTTGMHCAISLANLKNAQVYMLGGQLNPSSMSVSGSGTCDKIRTMNYDIAFLGATGYMHETGFNCGGEEESYLKQTIISRAEKSVVLMDSTKVEISNTFSFASVKDIDIVVSDDDLDPEVVRFFLDNDIVVI